MSNITITLTDDQRLFVKFILEEYVREHEITDEQLGLLNRVYKRIVSYAELIK